MHNFVVYFYLALGTGGILYRTLVVAVFLQHEEDCKDYLGTVTTILGIVFNILQMMLLIKYAKV